jgi:hypothetical protein
MVILVILFNKYNLIIFITYIVNYIYNLIVICILNAKKHKEIQILTKILVFIYKKKEIFIRLHRNISKFYKFTIL